MAKIPVNDLLLAFQRMRDEHWAYVAGSASKGKVDCSGAFVWAYRQHGQKIYHGSNRIARTEVAGLLPVSQAQPGMAAFKLRAPDNSKYDLPSGYKPGGKYHNGDLSDYYHIGLVGENGKVLNAQSTTTGFVESPIKSWDCVGYLNKVDYGGEAEVEENTNVLYVGIVSAQSGKTVNLRESATKSSTIVERVNIGTEVNVLEDLGEWLKVETADHQGYMMARYVVQQAEDADEVQILRERLDALEARIQALEGGAG